MKPTEWVVLIGFATFAGISCVAAQSEGDYLVAERGSHHRVMQRVTWETNALGRATARTNSYTELETGMHFQRAGQWVESRPDIELTQDGAAAIDVPHPVAFAPDILGTVDLTLPDGRPLRSRVVGLSYFDAASGESVLLAQTRSTPGLLLDRNQVLYTNAFTGAGGVEADVQYIVTKAGLEQNIVLHALPAPETVGLNGAVWLECLTEFFDPPVSERRTVAVTPEGLSDETIDFGSMAMGRGKAFTIGEPEADTRSVPVFKRWVVLPEGRSILVEQVPLTTVREQLQRLPGSGGGAGPINPRRSGPGHSLEAALAAVLPAPGHLADAAPAQMARLTSWSTRGFVLDYAILSSATNFTFQGDTTYYVTNTVNLSSTTVVEGGAVIKLSTNSSAKINVSGPIQSLTGPYRPALFTGKDDNTVGETISGSTGNPIGYYGAGIIISSSSNSLANLRFSHLKWALRFEISFGPDQLNLANLQFNKCQYPLVASQWTCFISCGLTVNLDNALAYGSDIFFQGDYGLLRARHLTVNQCNTLGSDSGNDCDLYLTNSLLVAVTNWGNIPYVTNTTAYFASDPGGIFQTVGAGAHYLVTNSVYRNVGTTNPARQCSRTSRA